MIRKIKTTEYLKGYDAMGDGERKDYRKRVGEWLAGGGKRLLEVTDRPMAKAQNIMLLSARWGREDCGAFYEGTLLLSALTGMADTWLPTQLFAKSAYRAVRQMADCLGSLNIENGTLKITHTGSKPKEEPAVNTRKGTQAVDTGSRKARITTIMAGGAVSVSQVPQTTATVKQGEAPVPVRPKHIDQYVHLLPQRTQEHAALVREMLRELDEARENARRLMDAGEHSDKIELWARKATRLDNGVRRIYDELDYEWDNLVKQGRVVVDDLGNAHVIESEKGKVNSEQSATSQELTSEQKTRRRELRKWLTDTRRGNGDTREEHLKKWDENFKEYLTLEPKDKALADRKILEAMKHYGIEV